MEEGLKKAILLVCGLLDKYTVQYIIVGGTAVALNGYYRHSTNMAGMVTDKPDIDIWYNPTYENYYKILKVMHELGHDTAEFENEQTPNPHRSFFKLDFDDFTLDLLPQIKADIKFRTANDQKETVELDDVKIHCISYIDLVKDKESTGRKKDIEDIRQLKKLREDGDAGAID